MNEDSATDAASDQPRRWFAFFLHPAFLAVVSLFLFLAVAAFTYRSTRFTGIPPIGEIVDRETEGRIDIKADDNAFTYYERAWNQLPATLDDEALTDAIKLLEAGGNTSEVTSAARIALDNCEATLAEWKRGTECERGVRVQPADAEWYDLIGAQESGTIRRLVIIKAALLLHEEGKADKAWTWLRALFRSSRHLGNPGPSMDRVIGTVFHTMGSKALVRWAANERVTASHLKIAIRELDTIHQMTVRNSVVLKHDYLTTSRFLSQPSQLRETHINYREIVPDGLKSVSGIYLFLNAEPDLADLLLRHVFANSLSQSDLPRRDRVLAGTRCPMFEPTGFEYPPLMDPRSLDNVLARSKLALSMSPPTHEPAITDREETRQNALVLCLNAELFRRTHGRYPTKLEDLVPEFIDQIPPDPYGSTSDERMLMTYRKTSDAKGDPETKDRYSGPGLIIYSRGENGIDDGGVPRSGDPGLKIPFDTNDNAGRN